MEEWKEYKLGEVVNVLDYKRVPLSSKERSTRQGCYPYYGAQGIIDYIDDYIFDGTYLLIAEDGENLNSQKHNVAQLANGKYWVNNHAHIVESNGKSDIRYICYLLNTLDLSGYITGSAQPKLNQANLTKITFNLPSLETQKRIADCLSVFDDKIENNKRINENLEQQAQALFKSWFVDFEPFKDQPFEESELGMIPKGWKVGTLNDVAELRKPSIRPQDKIFYTHYSIPAFDNSKKPSADEGSTIKSNKFGISDGAVLLSKLNPSTKRIWYTGIVPNNSVSSTEFLPFYSKNQKFTPFLYCYLNYNRNYNEIANGAKGTTNSHQRIDANSILNRNLAISEEAIDKFSDCCQSFMNLILAANQESRRLAQIRDLLLPKLMSGELKINDVEKNL